MDIADLIIKNSAGNLYWKDRNSIYRGCNKNFLNLIKLNSPEEINGKTDFDFLTDTEKAKKIIDSDQEVMLSGQEKICEERGIDASGNDAFYISHKIPVFNEEGETIGLIGTSIDITQQKKAEFSLIEQTQEKILLYERSYDFLAILSHQVRGTMSSVVSGIEILRRLNLNNNKVDNILQKIFTASSHLIKDIDYVIKTLLLYKTDFNFKYTDGFLSDFFENILEVHERDSTKSIIFQYFVDLSVSERNICYEQQYTREIIDILLINAIKYSHEGGVVTLAVRPKEHFLIYSVKDQGKGISASNLKNIRNRLSKSSNNDQKNTQRYRYLEPSIKLNYIKVLLDFMGGNLSIDSDKNGTTVLVSIPFIQNNVHTVNNVTPSLSLKVDQIENAKILLIDDEEISLYFEEHELKEIVSHVDIAKSGNEGVKMGLKNDYDVIFSDISMPDITGIEVIQKINAENKKKGKPPCVAVAVTSRGLEEDINHFIENGFTEVLVKPVHKIDFYSCIKTLLKIKQSVD